MVAVPPRGWHRPLREVEPHLRVVHVGRDDTIVDAHVLELEAAGKAAHAPPRVGRVHRATLAARPVEILLERQPEQLQRVGRVVGVADAHRTAHRLRRGVEGGGERVVGPVLPVLRPRLAARRAINVRPRCVDPEDREKWIVGGGAGAAGPGGHFAPRRWRRPPAARRQRNRRAAARSTVVCGLAQAVATRRSRNERRRDIALGGERRTASATVPRVIAEPPTGATMLQGACRARCARRVEVEGRGSRVRRLAAAGSRLSVLGGTTQGGLRAVSHGGEPCHPAGAAAKPARVSGSASLPRWPTSGHAPRSRHSLAALAPAG